MLAIPESTIRFWEREFAPLIKPHRQGRGWRRYTEEDLHTLELIDYLVRKKGLRIEKAKELLTASKEKISSEYSMVKELEEVKQFLLRLKNSLQSLI